MSDNESSSQLSNPSTRNTLQNQQDGNVRLIPTGVNVSHSSIHSLTPIEHLEHLNLTEQHQHIEQHFHQHQHAPEHHHHEHRHEHTEHHHHHEHHHHEHQHHEHHEHHHQHIEQHHHEHRLVEHHHHHLTENHLHVEQINLLADGRIVVQNTRKFDEAKFRIYFRNIKCTYADMFRKGRPITEYMYENTPVLKITTVTALETSTANKDTLHGHTKISQTFPVDMDDPNNRLIALTGEPGAGKTVYLHILRSFYIKQDFFPFPLDFSKLALMKDKLLFPELIMNCACPDFPFEDPKLFGIWMVENQTKCLFFADGLDQAPFIIKEDVAPANIQNSVATVETWMSLLFSGHIMPASKVVFSSRKASVQNLSVSQRPEVIYSMNGFSDESLPGVVGTYNREYKDQILSFIKSKGSNVVNYARNPFVIALISLVYNTASALITSKTTITELYQHAFEELNCSTHNRDRRKKDDETEDKVDRFYYQMFMEGKISFTEEHVLKHGLTMEQLENYSWINISSKRASSFIRAKHKIVTPIHQSLMEYHISRYIMGQMELDDFNNLVQTKLYNLHDQDKWMMIRRFISGLVNTEQFDEAKNEAFLKQFVKELRASTSDNLWLKYLKDSNKMVQAYILQGNLYSDLVELGTQLDVIKKEFTDATDMKLQVGVKDSTSVEGATFFLQNIDPPLQQLIFVLSHDFNLKSSDFDFKTFSTAVANLSKKMESAMILNIPAFDGHVKGIGKILTKTVQRLRLLYNDQVNADEILSIKHQLQNLLDQTESTQLFVLLEHKGCRHLIKHSSYTSMTSSIIKPSLFDGAKKTVNFYAGNTKTIIEELKTNNQTSNFKYDFMLAESQELEKLNETLIHIPSMKIRIIDLYFPHDVSWGNTRIFINSINQLENKVEQIFFYNLISSEVSCDDILVFIPKIKDRLGFYYLENLDEDMKKDWMKRLQNFPTSPTLEVRIYFNRALFIRSPSSKEWIFSYIGY